MRKGEIPCTRENVQAALRHISPSGGREEWFRVLAAIKAGLGEDGRDLAEAWSAEGDSYDKASFKDAWKSIRAGGKVTVGTLWGLALAAGWKPDGQAREETPEEREARERERKARQDRDAKKKAQAERDAAKKAAAWWKAALPASHDNPYLQKKAVSPVETLRESTAARALEVLGYSPKSDGEPLTGRLLLVPLKINGKLSTLELIDEQGRKSAIAGGAKSGGFWAAQPLPRGDGGGVTLAIGEGVSTSLSAHQAAEFPVLAALMASNLPKVARAMRERLPLAQLLILGDVGGALKYAQQAATATGAALAVPEFTPEQVQAFEAEHGKPPSDFNDLAALAGLDEVRRQLHAALAASWHGAQSAEGAASPDIAKPDVTDVTGVTANDGGASGGYASRERDVTGVTGAGSDAKPEGAETGKGAVPPAIEKSDVTDVTGVTANDGGASGGYASRERDVTGVTGAGSDAKPGKVVAFPGAGPGTKPPKGKGSPGGGDDDEEPALVVREAWSRFGPPGVWYHGHRSGKGEAEPLNLWLCSPLHIEGISCGENGHGFGRILRFVDPFGVWHTWAMPMSLLGGSGEELRRELLDAGVLIDYRERARLAEYLQWRLPERRVLAATRTGWTRDGLAFVLPEHVIGSADVYYQSETMYSEGTASAGGDFATWKAEIAALCVGNPVLALSMCVALAGPLLAKVHRDSGGIHWVGDSSTGKSTALNVGCSAWGGDTFRRTWRATANGLEGAAASLNDCCLALDEIGEADPKEVGAIVYSLGNGIGKSRAGRTGSARQVFRWRLTLLSTGEKALATLMEEGGKQAKAGQLIRLLSIPATRKAGAFDNLHGFPGGREMADRIKTLCGQHYGYAGPAFIEAMLRDGRDFGAALAEVEALPQFQAETSQESRGASRFALYCVAGELATEWGILPWNPGEALSAAAEGYRLWKESRGGGSTEDSQILRAVKDFISKHGDARFSEKATDEEDQKQPNVIGRAGWWLDLEDVGRLYLFTGQGLREAGQGHDFNRVLAALDAAGWIHARGHNGECSRVVKIGKKRTERLYHILPGDLGE